MSLLSLIDFSVYKECMYIWVTPSWYVYFLVILSYFCILLFLFYFCIILLFVYVWGNIRRWHATTLPTPCSNYVPCMTATRENSKRYNYLKHFGIHFFQTLINSKHFVIICELHITLNLHVFDWFIVSHSLATGNNLNRPRLSLQQTTVLWCNLQNFTELHSLSPSYFYLTSFVDMSSYIFHTKARLLCNNIYLFVAFMSTCSFHCIYHFRKCLPFFRWVCCKISFGNIVSNVMSLLILFLLHVIFVSFPCPGTRLYVLYCDNNITICIILSCPFLSFPLPK